jgi:hypothetical protein
MSEPGMSGHSMSGLETEFPFQLPKGYVDQDGNLCRNGVMRLATGADEILPLKDPRVEKNPAYLFVIILSRVLIKLDNVTSINPSIIESLFSEDLWYLQRLYHEVNGASSRQCPTACPQCNHEFAVEIALGES